MNQSNKTIGILFITGGFALLVPYTMLTMIFNYPAILRQDTATILTKFHEGGNRLIWTWFAFSMTGIPLLPVYIMLGQKLESKSPFIRVATTIGVIGLLAQMIGLLRWTFVVPMLADTFVHTTDHATMAATIASFNTVHQFGGVLLGEHLGQLFTVGWTVMMTLSFCRLKMLPWWLNILACVSSIIYFMGQADLIATVIKGFPVWSMAGFIGSTLWLIWLIAMGIFMVRQKPPIFRDISVNTLKHQKIPL